MANITAQQAIDRVADDIKKTKEAVNSNKSTITTNTTEVGKKANQSAVDANAASILTKLPASPNSTEADNFLKNTHIETGITSLITTHAGSGTTDDTKLPLDPSTTQANTFFANTNVVSKLNTAITETAIEKPASNGTTGQVLISNGANTPTWADATGGTPTDTTTIEANIATNTANIATNTTSAFDNKTLSLQNQTDIAANTADIAAIAGFKEYDTYTEMQADAANIKSGSTGFVKDMQGASATTSGGHTYQWRPTGEGAEYKKDLSGNFSFNPYASEVYDKLKSDVVALTTKQENIANEIQANFNNITPHIKGVLSNGDKTLTYTWTANYPIGTSLEMQGYITATGNPDVITRRILHMVVGQSFVNYLAYSGVVIPTKIVASTDGTDITIVATRVDDEAWATTLDHYLDGYIVQPAIAQSTDNADDNYHFRMGDITEISGYNHKITHTTNVLNLKWDDIVDYDILIGYSTNSMVRVRVLNKTMFPNQASFPLNIRTQIGSVEYIFGAGSNIYNEDSGIYITRTSTNEFEIEATLKSTYRAGYSPSGIGSPASYFGSYIRTKSGNGAAADLTPYRTASAQDVIDAVKLEADALTPYRTSGDQDTIDTGKADANASNVSAANVLSWQAKLGIRSITLPKNKYLKITSDQKFGSVMLFGESGTYSLSFYTSTSDIANTSFTETNGGWTTTDAYKVKVFYKAASNDLWIKTSSEVDCLLLYGSMGHDWVISILDTQDNEPSGLTQVTTGTGTTDLTPYRTSANQDTIDATKLEAAALTPYRTSGDQDTIDATKLTKPTSDGTTGQILTSNGASAPTWEDAPSGGTTTTITNATLVPDHYYKVLDLPSGTTYPGMAFDGWFNVNGAQDNDLSRNNTWTLQLQKGAGADTLIIQAKTTNNPIADWEWVYIGDVLYLHYKSTNTGNGKLSIHAVRKFDGTEIVLPFSDSGTATPSGTAHKVRFDMRVPASQLVLPNDKWVRITDDSNYNYGVFTIRGEAIFYIASIYTSSSSIGDSQFTAMNTPFSTDTDYNIELWYKASTKILWLKTSSEVACTLEHGALGGFQGETLKVWEVQDSVPDGLTQVTTGYVQIGTSASVAP